MSILNNNSDGAAIEEGFLVNLTSGLNGKEYTGPYRNFYFGPVAALNGDMSYTQDGITLVNVATETRVLFVIQHAENETEKGSLRAFRRGKRLWYLEMARGTGEFFADPTCGTLLSVSRQQDMNCAPRRLVSPKGQLVSQLEGANVVLNKGPTPGDISIKILTGSDEDYIQFTNTTPYLHICSGEQPSLTYPQKALASYNASMGIHKPYRPDKGPTKIFSVPVLPHSTASVLHPPTEFGIYALATVAQMSQGDPIQGGRSVASFNSHIRSELPELSKIDVVAYAPAKRGQVATLVNGTPINGPEKIIVTDAENCQPLDYSMSDNVA